MKPLHWRLKKESGEPFWKPKDSVLSAREASEPQVLIGSDSDMA